MKKINKIKIKISAVWFSLVAVLFPFQSFAEEKESKKSSIGIKVGPSIANESVSIAGIISISPSSRTGLSIGAEFLYDVHQNISLGAGLAYIQKGAEISIEGITVKDTLNYLSIPIPVRVQADINAGPDVNLRPFGLFSLEPSFLLSAKTEVKSEGTTEEQDITDSLEGLDFGIGFGGGLGLYWPTFFLSAEGRYVLGLTNIYKGAEAEIKNRAFIILVGAGLRF